MNRQCLVPGQAAFASFRRPRSPLAALLRIDRGPTLSLAERLVSEDTAWASTPRTLLDQALLSDRA
ncbi:MAG: hypothetical protein ACI8XD_000870 [Thermoproteota archaeon]|jgi:hypothetical protein